MAARGITTKSRWRSVCILTVGTICCAFAFYLWPKSMDADYIARREIANYASRHDLPQNSWVLISKETSDKSGVTFDYELGNHPRHDVRVEVSPDGHVEVSRMIDE